jgi:hypothetical protein
MTDELEILRRHRGEPSAPEERVRDAARTALALAVAAEPRSSGGHAQRKRARRPLALRLALTLALVLALALALSIGLPAALRTGSSSAPQALAAGPVLRQLANVAAARPTLVPGPGQFLYTATNSLSGGDTVLPGNRYCQATYREYRQDWVAQNGEGLTVERVGPSHYGSTGEARACHEVPMTGPEPRWNWAAPGCMVIQLVPLGRLPRDPALLRARLLTGKVEGGPPGPGEAFVQVADLLRKTDAPAAIRAALFRAAAGLQGVHALGTVRDGYGRQGVALAIDHQGYRSELIFSTKTSDILEERDILVRPVHGVHARIGATLSRTTYSIPRVVDALPKPSPLPLRPACIRGGETGRQVPGHPNEWVNIGVAPKR